MNNFYIASFDIGLKNFCFYVENLNINNILKIKNISIKNRYKVDRTPTLEFKKILENIYKNGSTILHENIDLTVGCASSKSKSKLNCDILLFYDKYFR